MSPFKWTAERSAAAIALAEGRTIKEAAKMAGVTDRSVKRWKGDSGNEEFMVEVNKLSLMVDVAGRGGRLRIAMRIIRDKLEVKKGDDKPMTDKDLLDWLKYVQSETDGVKLDLTKQLAALIDDAPPVA